MLHVVLRLRHDCALSRLSARNPLVPFAQWCNYRRDVVEMRAPDAAARAALHRDLGSLAADGFEVLAGDDQTTHVTMTCGHQHEGDGIDETIARHDAVALQPVLYQAGWEQYRIVVPKEGRTEPLMAALRQIGEVKIVRKRRSQGQFLDGAMLLSSADILGDLTHHQSRALAAAVEAGYYEVPRKARFQDIAERAGQPRTTFEEHARKAEAKVIRAVAPYLGAAAPPERSAANGRATRLHPRSSPPPRR